MSTASEGRGRRDPGSPCHCCCAESSSERCERRGCSSTRGETEKTTRVAAVAVARWENGAQPRPHPHPAHAPPPPPCRVRGGVSLGETKRSDAHAIHAGLPHATGRTTGGDPSRDRRSLSLSRDRRGAPGGMGWGGAARPRVDGLGGVGGETR
ncbi:unnamed protein product [Lampetra fluviatilis]